MNSTTPLLTLRAFLPDDAEFCFKVRTKAYIVAFFDELGPHAVTAAVNAYMPDDYVRMAETHPCFIVENHGERVGFVTLKRHDATTAEIPLLYLDLAEVGRGIGKWCMRSIQTWVTAHWPGVNTLVVETIIPRYNGGFYRKMGFAQIGETFCCFPDGNVKAIRFEKSLGG